MTRQAELAELGGIVTEFVEPRRHTEILEHRTWVVSPRTGRKRSTVIRSTYATVLPSLLAALRVAAFPVAGGSFPSGAFESQSPANDSAIDALVTITTQVAGWCKLLHVNADTERGQMRRLVGARHTDGQLSDLLGEARGWRQTARVAVGEEEALRILNQPCPSCLRRNALAMRADGSYVRCQVCARVWDETMVGLLAQMLASNRSQETLAVNP